MLPSLLVGAGLGVMWGAFAQSRASDQPDGTPNDDEHLQEEQQQGQQQQQQQQQHSQLQPLQDNPAQQQPSRRRHRLGSAGYAAVAVGGLACVVLAAVGIALGRRRHGRHKQRPTRTDGRIPLKDLIRFKERQWFVEELENARDADPNSMIRLAKMYLNGQGCQRNIAMAQEWVRKARSMGVPATLDELYATDDPDPHTKLRTLAAMEERRRALRQLNTTAAKAAHQHVPQQPQQRHTAAA